MCFFGQYKFREVLTVQKTPSVRFRKVVCVENIIGSEYYSVSPYSRDFHHFPGIWVRLYNRVGGPKSTSKFSDFFSDF